MSKNIKAGGGSFRLEDMIDPKTFFDLGCWSNGRIGNKLTGFTISENHMYLVNRLKESGIFRINYSQMHRGLLILGLLTECLYHNLYEKKVTNIIQKSKMSRQQFNVAEITSVIGLLEKNDDSDNMLLRNYIKYGKCKYGAHVSNFISDIIGPATQSYGTVDKVAISQSIKRLCESYSKEPPADSKYKLKRNKSNEYVKFWLPNQVKIICFNLLKSGIVDTRIMSDIYRSGYVTGLYVMCKWIIASRIPLDEFLYCKIIHEIYDYLSEHA